MALATNDKIFVISRVLFLAFTLTASCFAGPIQTIPTTGTEQPPKRPAASGISDTAGTVRLAPGDAERQIPEPLAFLLVGSGLITLSVGARYGRRLRERRLKTSNDGESFATDRSRVSA